MSKSTLLKQVLTGKQTVYRGTTFIDELMYISKTNRIWARRAAITEDFNNAGEGHTGGNEGAAVLVSNVGRNSPFSSYTTNVNTAKGFGHQCYLEVNISSKATAPGNMTDFRRVGGVEHEILLTKDTPILEARFHIPSKNASEKTQEFVINQDLDVEKLGVALLQHLELTYEDYKKKRERAIHVPEGMLWFSKQEILERVTKALQPSYKRNDDAAKKIFEGARVQRMTGPSTNNEEEEARKKPLTAYYERQQQDMPLKTTKIAPNMKLALLRNKINPLPSSIARSHKGRTPSGKKGIF